MDRICLLALCLFLFLPASILPGAPRRALDAVACDPVALLLACDGRLKLGQPSARVHDCAWLDRNYSTDYGTARGALVPRGKGECVPRLELVTPAVAEALVGLQMRNAGRAIAH